MPVEKCIQVSIEAQILLEPVIGAGSDSSQPDAAVWAQCFTSHLFSCLALSDRAHGARYLLYPGQNLSCDLGIRLFYRCSLHLTRCTPGALEKLLIPLTPMDSITLTANCFAVQVDCKTRLSPFSGKGVMLPGCCRRD